MRVTLASLPWAGVLLLPIWSSYQGYGVVYTTFCLLTLLMVKWAMNIKDLKRYLNLCFS
jgi:hypothetical protein